MSSSTASLRPAAIVILANFFSKLWTKRYLVGIFVQRDLKSRYVGSFMGFFWAVVHPLVLLTCYSVVFSGVLEIEIKYPQIADSFAVFLFSGLLPWLYFQDTVSRACSSVVDQANLVRKTALPSEILPLSIALSNLVTHLVGVAILLAVLVYFGTLGWNLLFLPVLLFLVAVFALGLGWICAALHVFLRDTAQVLTVCLTFWFWFTPIFYRIENVGEGLRPYLRLNPMSWAVEGYRAILLDNRPPGAVTFLVLALWAGAAFCVGGILFRSTKREFVDVL